MLLACLYPRAGGRATCIPDARFSERCVRGPCRQRVARRQGWPISGRRGSGVRRGGQTQRRTGPPMSHRRPSPTRGFLPIPGRQETTRRYSCLRRADRNQVQRMAGPVGPAPSLQVSIRPNLGLGPHGHLADVVQGGEDAQDTKLWDGEHRRGLGHFFGAMMLRMTRWLWARSYCDLASTPAWI